MSQAECPKCGQPREAEALDCPWCGIVFARFRGGPPPPPLPPETAAAQPPTYSAEPPDGDGQPRTAPPEPQGEAPAAGDVYPGDVYQGDVYQGELYEPPPAGTQTASLPGQRRGGAPTVEKFDTPLTRNMVVSLLVCGLLCLFAQGFWNQEMLNGSVRLEGAQDRFFALTGFEAPEGLDDGSAIKFAGRDFVRLESTGGSEQDPGLAVYAFRPGPLAGRVGRIELLETVEGLMQRANWPYEEIASRESGVRGGGSGLSRTYGFGPGVPVQLFALAVEPPSGPPTLVVMFGSTGRVASVARRVAS